MAASERDEFPKAIRDALAKRAHYFCSNPRCLRMTVSPHADEAKAVVTGVGAHIRAAASGGPRYDATQTPGQRKSIQNGIWLCHVCSDLVDKNERAYPPQLLSNWKKEHESLISELVTKGYSQSLEILRSNAVEPEIARRLIAFFEDRRVLWSAFDAEIPSRVRASLGILRGQLSSLRGELANGSKLDALLTALSKAILIFFDRVESLDMDRLRCNAGDPDWICFSDELGRLRKSVGIQLTEIVRLYNFKVSEDLTKLVVSAPVV